LRISRLLTKLAQPRFSLRALLILVTVAVMFFAWRDRPRQMASEFRSALSKAGGTKESLQLCGLQSMATLKRWTVRDITMSEFRQSPGMAGWLFNQREAHWRIYVYDRKAGYGSTTGIMSANAWGVTPQPDGSWVSELPPLVQWFLEQ